MAERSHERFPPAVGDVPTLSQNAALPLHLLSLGSKQCFESRNAFEVRYVGIHGAVPPVGRVQLAEGDKQPVARIGDSLPRGRIRWRIELHAVQAASHEQR